MGYIRYHLALVCLLSSGSLTAARLAEPPQRSSLWRANFDTIRNHDDHFLNCGGYQNLKKNKGVCGVCGDPADGPKHHEVGGKYASGIISKRYPAGSTSIPVSVDLLLFHRGYFQFRICPQNNASAAVRQSCLDNHLLHIEESRDTKYAPESSGLHNLTLRLPQGLSCTHCVIQWRYRGSNFWGTCNNGSEGLGCGHQMEFYNCADVAIDSPTAVRGNGARLSPPAVVDPGKTTPFGRDGSAVQQTLISRILTPPANPASRVIAEPERPTSTDRTSNAVRQTSTWTTRSLTTRRELPSCFGSYRKVKFFCKGKGLYGKQMGIGLWCDQECAAGYCQLSICDCNCKQNIKTKKCVPTKAFRMVPGSLSWCETNCSRDFCPPSHCRC